jgi:alkyl hydroperoxide reductase subunit AhpC
MGCDIVTVSTDTTYVHQAWQRAEKDLANVKYTMASDRTTRVSRMFGVYDENTGHALRGAFLISPKGQVLSVTMTWYNLGRNVDELMRQFKANVYLSKKAVPDACPSKWQDEGDKTMVNRDASG